MLYERTLGQWLEHWAATTPDKEYIVYSDRNLRFTWSQFNRRVDDMAKGLIAIGVERGTHVGIWAANVPDWLTLRQNRRRLRNGKHQLQTSRTGIPVRELGYAHALHRQRRKRQRLRADDLYHAAGIENLPARTSEERTLPLHEECNLRRTGEAQGDVQHLRNPAPGRQYRRHPAGRTEKPG